MPTADEIGALTGVLSAAGFVELKKEDGDDLSQHQHPGSRGPASAGVVA